METPRHTRWRNLDRLTIIDESPDWIVVEKPPFVEAHPTRPNGRVTLWDGLRELLAYELANGGQVSIITRLDRETSGLTLVAKHRAAARWLCDQMEAHGFEKEYLAVVWGWPEWETRAVDAPILRQGKRAPTAIYLKQMVHPDGAPAQTAFRVEARFTRETSNGQRFSLIRAFPKTGRTHQIRVHLAHLGHAVVGDKIYGPDEGCYLEFIDTGWTPALAERLLLPRHALHAAQLRLPAHGLAWASPLPPDLAAWAGENFLASAERKSL